MSVLSVSVLKCFLSELIPSVLLLSTSVWRILLMSGLNLSVSLASVSLVNPIGVYLKCFPTSYAGSIQYLFLLVSV